MTMQNVLSGLAVVVAVGLAGVPAGGAAAQDRVDARQANQAARIAAGGEAGELTPGEARRLGRQQRRIARAERRAEADGVVTPGEARRLERRQNRASRAIQRARHNARR